MDNVSFYLRVEMDGMLVPRVAECLDQLVVRRKGRTDECYWNTDWKSTAAVS